MGVGARGLDSTTVVTCFPCRHRCPCNAPRTRRNWPKHLLKVDVFAEEVSGCEVVVVVVGVELRRRIGGRGDGVGRLRGWGQFKTEHLWDGQAKGRRGRAGRESASSPWKYRSRSSMARDPFPMNMTSGSKAMRTNRAPSNPEKDWVGACMLKKSIIIGIFKTTVETLR